MGWTRIRIVPVAGDVDQHGLSTFDDVAISDAEFFGVGPSEIRDGKIRVLAAWCTAGGSLVSGLGTITLALLQMVEMQPYGGNQVVRHIAQSQVKIDRQGWEAEDFEATPGRYSVRASDMAPPAGATHVSLWYWSA